MTTTLPFERSPRAVQLESELRDFMRQRVEPQVGEFHRQLRAQESPWRTPALLDQLQVEARAAGLWNLFLPAEDPRGAGLTNAEYAPLCEIMGRVLWAPEVFNCNAPDTGNMEVLARYGTPAQQRAWLDPLLEGRIRSAFCMTEPEVASSDATNIATRIARDGDDYVINGRKWYSTGVLRENCELLIVMGKTDPAASRHTQQSMIIVPRATPGVEVVRALDVFNDDDAPGGHGEVVFTDVRVPSANLLLGEGRGFEIAQGRLGPGRVHHCMRLIGLAEAALESMCRRATAREAFGRPLAQFDSIRKDVARSRVEIDQARLLTLAAAVAMDRHGNKAARKQIAAIKVVVPSMAQRVIDRSIQVHGGLGLTNDVELARSWIYARSVRIADGPDEVHLDAIAKMEFAELAGGKASGRPE
ncbi:MAG TPA: acyl-CoA dehydrogenase family protein [Steroidobacteraceae bacterium]|nr:acyl-CoA dehydrogenase family protein [Steroidobacteraceae bacterium]